MKATAESLCVRKRECSERRWQTKDDNRAEVVSIPHVSGGFCEARDERL
jgi:hypothetical protein